MTIADAGKIRNGCILTSLTLVSLCFACVLYAAPPATAETFKAKVIGVSDGDTIKVLRGREQITIRLEAIDAPEVKQSYGNRAKQALADITFGETVTINKTGEDRFGRTLAFVEAKGVEVNAKMITDGWAWHYKKYNDDSRLAQLEGQARDARRGLWADPTTPLAPWDFRARSRVTNDEPPPASARYWLNTSSNVRHNLTCEHFGKTKKGRECTSTEGKPCGICGG
jgi:endonuclease YncB( thermonuclease family)